MTTFPDFVTALPLADLSLPGVTAWLLDGAPRQVVFFRLEPGMTVPEHSHGAQWGIVVDGELELTIAGVTRTCRRGDSYSIPEGAPHSASCHTAALVLDVFADAKRYRPRPRRAE